MTYNSCLSLTLIVLSCSKMNKNEHKVEVPFLISDKSHPRKCTYTFLNYFTILYLFLIVLIHPKPNLGALYYNSYFKLFLNQPKKYIYLF